MTPDHRLKVLLVGDYPDDPTLGSAKVAYKLREELRALGHACDVFFGPGLGAAPRSRQVRQLVAPVLACRAVARAIRRHRYDVVDIASGEGLWIGVARRLGPLRTTAFVCRSHGLEHLNYQRMLDDADAGLMHKPWTRRLWYPASRLSQVAGAARLSDRLIVLNEPDRRFAISRGWKAADRIDLIPHGVSQRFLAPAGDDRNRGRGALFCGSWDHAKGVRYLVDAWRRLAARGAGVPLTVLGPGIDPEHVRQAFPESARSLVTVVPRAPEHEVIAAYRTHDLLVFPSTYEGFGLVVLEAMSQGLPVIATPVGCAASLLSSGHTGVLIAPRDADALADAVARLMAEPSYRRRLGGNAAGAVAHMSWRHTAERTVQSYRTAIESLR